MDELRFFQKAEAFRQAVLVPGGNFFSQLLQAQGQRKLGSDGITVRSDVAEDDDPVCLLIAPAISSKGGLH